MESFKQELLKSLTFEYLQFLSKSNMYTEAEKNERIIALEKIKQDCANTLDENDLDNALYWTISNYTTSLAGHGVSSVPHMVSFTDSLLKEDHDWQTRYRNFY